MESNKLFYESINVNKDILGGKAVIKGTRFPISQLLEELSDGYSISEICEDYDLNKETTTKCLRALALLLDKSFII